MRKIAAILVIGGIANFLLFFLFSLVLGGDALNGRIDANGDYLLAEHGRTTKVSPAVWHYSRVHAISVYFTHPLAIVGFGLLAISFKRAKPKRPEP